MTAKTLNPASAICPDCGKPSEWAVEFGTGKQVAAVCLECSNSYGDECADLYGHESDFED